MLECVPCTLEHVKQLAPRLREIDKKEIELVSGMSPEAGLEDSVNASTEAWAWIEDGLVLCVFGVAPMPGYPKWGNPWLLASDDAVARGRRLVRYCNEKITAMHSQFPYLYNMVHADNAVAIRWLKWCGFKFGQPFRVRGALFLPFARFKDVCASSSSSQ